MTTNTLRGSPRIPKAIDYGLTNAYGSTTALTTLYGSGATTGALPAALLPNTTYHWRGTATNAAGTYTGLDATFLISLPVFATQAATGIYWDKAHKATLNGNVSSMGDASSVYVRFRYSNDPAMVVALNLTPEQSVTATGAVSASISGYSPAGPVYYQTVTRIGATTTYGTVMSFTPGATGTSGSSFGAWMIFYLVPIILGIGIVWISLKDEGPTLGIIVGVAIAIIGVVLVNILFG
jgi:hypothetical protein